ncbi:MAG: hypothetical protein GXO99_05335 [Nitrospirae bacterium]|nr:hypothetical protein [Nitrospirota bacterium]
MKVLIIKNIPIEGPGTIEDFLKNNQIEYVIRDFSKGELVRSSAEFTHLIVMGGPMAVYEMDRYSYLKDEAKLIEDFIKKEKAVLGICLGAQMLAHVLGARVYAGDTKEIGWYEVDLTEEGLKDSAIKELEIGNTKKAEVFQWHGDTFVLPDGAVRVASSEAYSNQAFRYGKSYALQFHIEVTPEIINEWFKDDKNREQMVSHTKKIFDEYLKRAMGFYSKFFS